MVHPLYLEYKQTGFARKHSDHSQPAVLCFFTDDTFNRKVAEFGSKFIDSLPYVIIRGRTGLEKCYTVNQLTWRLHDTNPVILRQDADPSLHLGRRYLVFVNQEGFVQWYEREIAQSQHHGCYHELVQGKAPVQC